MSSESDPVRATTFREKKKRALVRITICSSNFFPLQLKGKRKKLVSLGKL